MVKKRDLNQVYYKKVCLNLKRKMTIFFNLCSLGGGFVCLGISGYLGRVFFQKRIDTFRGFSFALFFLGLAFSVLSFPGLVLFDLFLIQIDFVLADFFFFGGIFFFVLPFLSFFNMSTRFEKLTICVIILGAVLYFLANVLFFAPAIPLKTDNTVFYWKSGTPLIQGLTHGLFCLVGFGMTTFFFKKYRVLKEKDSSRKTFLLGTSGILMSIGGFILWFFPFFYFNPPLLAISGIAGFSGAVAGMVIPFFFENPPRSYEETAN